MRRGGRAVIGTQRGVPELGQLVRVRDRHWVVADGAPSQLPRDILAAPSESDQTLLALSSVEDDGLGEQISVIWELEPGAEVLQTATLPTPVAGRVDPPAQQAAFLDAVRWGAVTLAAVNALQAPFRWGITLEGCWLEPMCMPVTGGSCLFHPGCGGSESDLGVAKGAEVPFLCLLAGERRQQCQGGSSRQYVVAG